MELLLLCPLESVFKKNHLNVTLLTMLCTLTSTEASVCHSASYGAWVVQVALSVLHWSVKSC